MFGGSNCSIKSDREKANRVSKQHASGCINLINTVLSVLFSEMRAEISSTSGPVKRTRFGWI